MNKINYKQYVLWHIKNKYLNNNSMMKNYITLQKREVFCNFGIKNENIRNVLFLKYVDKLLTARKRYESLNE